MNIINIWNKSNLYCDGHPKPFMRGWLHVCMTFITPIVGLWHVSQIADNSTIYVKIPIYGYLASQTICYGVSSLYHRVNWSKKRSFSRSAKHSRVGVRWTPDSTTNFAKNEGDFVSAQLGEVWTRSQEIFVLKLDICCIGLYEFGSYLPMYFFVLPKYSPIIAVFFGTMTFYAMMSHWYHIWVKLDPSPLRLFYVGATIIPFFPILMTLLTWEEIGYMCATIVLQSAGMMVFMYKKPDPFPTIFGYHEIFHLLVVAGGATCYAGNMSIIKSNTIYSLKL